MFVKIGSAGGVLEPLLQLKKILLYYRIFPSFIFLPLFRLQQHCFKLVWHFELLKAFFKVSIRDVPEDAVKDSRKSVSNFN